MSRRDERDPYHRPPSRTFAQPWVRFVALMIYYLAILVALVVFYGQGDFSTPPFVYQNF
jgi:hypothetical protein